MGVPNAKHDAIGAILAHARLDTAPPRQPIRLAHAKDLSSFSFFTRGSVGEHLLFGSRTVVQRTEPGQRQTIELKDIPFVVHAYARVDGLCGACITDSEYPIRVAFSLINKMLSDYERALQNKWKAFNTDQPLEPKELFADLKRFENPAEADKLLKIQTNLEEIKGVMHKNIDQILQRGVKLEELMEKSGDLSATSVHFYKQAKKTNQCCKWY